MALQRFNNVKLKKKVELKLWHKLLFLSPILIIVIIYKSNYWYNSYMLANNGIETTGKIAFVSLTGVRDEFDVENVAYYFNYNNNKIIGYTVSETNNNYVLLENGMPLLINNEFIVKFVKDNPEINKIDFSKPNNSTLIKYIKITSDTLSKIFNNLQNVNFDCIAKNVFKTYGFDGLATIIFYNENIVENFKHNSITFNKFICKKEFKEIIKKCR